jgi:hypothetical protein
MDKPNSSELPPLRPLRFAYPAYYRLLQEQLELKHLHPFDVAAGVAEQEGKLAIALRYGEKWKRSERTFSRTELEETVAGLVDFFRETAEDCMKTLIADAYKIAKG